MEVYLYHVGRNLNRAVRTCEAFGVQRLHLIDCAEVWLSGNLYGARGRVDVAHVSDWPDAAGLCLLETWAKPPLWRVPWGEVRALLLGGETDGLPRETLAQYRAAIPLQGHISGLTVEAALAIALYEWRRKEAVF